MKHRLLAGVLLLIMLFCVGGCEPADHEKALSEVASKNAVYQEQRQEFLRSSLCRTAEAYVKDRAEELFPGCAVRLSLEPGELLGRELPEDRQFLEDKNARTEFFSKAELTLEIDLPEGTDPQQAARELVDKQISGRLFVGSTHDKYYLLGAEKGTAELIWVPEV